MSSVNLISILEKIIEENKFFPVFFKNGGIRLEGEAAWRKWKRWADINRRDDFVYKILDSIKRQNYQASPKQMQVLINWFNR